MMTDPIADMLTRIRNANFNRFAEVSMPASKVKQGIAQVLETEGYILGSEVKGEKPSEKQLNIQLKYKGDDLVISGIKRVSKPGLRVYVGHDKIPRVMGGLGIAMLSTSKGIMSGKKAKELGIGGEILCHVW